MSLEQKVREAAALCITPHSPLAGDLKHYVYDAEHRALLLQVAERLARVEGWQPIETAPKDRDILISGGTVERYCDDLAAFTGVTIAFWDRDHWHGDELNQHDEWKVHAPTHWMPLPEPPALPPIAGEVSR